MLIVDGFVAFQPLRKALATQNCFPTVCMPDSFLWFENCNKISLAFFLGKWKKCILEKRRGLYQECEESGVAIM